MNKTVQIQLGGRVFFVEEEAYEVLRSYLDKLESHFAHSPDAREIIRDIEGRLAELALDRLDVNKAQALTSEDLDYMLGTMGNPWEEDGLEADKEEAETEEKATNPHRRLYRDTQDKILGGVCSGFSHYLGLDPILLRFLFLIAFFIFGSGVILYILLWIVMPEAKTRAERLQMKGEPVNARNIGQQVKDEVHKVKEQVANSGQEIRSAADKISGLARELFEAVGVALKGLLLVLGKILGVVFILAGLCLTTLITGVALGFEPLFLSSGGVLDPFILPDARWDWLRLTIPVSILIPAVLLLLAGLRLLLDLRWGSKWLTMVLVIIWLGALGFNIQQGMAMSLQFREEVELVQDHEWEVSPMAPIVVHLGRRTTTGEIDSAQGSDIKTDESGYRTVHSRNLMTRMLPEERPNRIHLEVESTRDDQAWVRITSGARGRTATEARTHAEAIQYTYRIQDNEIWLHPGFDVPAGTTWAAQTLDVVLGIPEGRSVLIERDLDQISCSYWGFRKCRTMIQGWEYYELYAGPKGLYCPVEHKGMDSL